ncbi:MAG: IclR family transcriptional regulator C-terminal domain-containing protein [Ferrovibrio sp.]|uniref:IclR family transcriptional regulator domain-containing protein n=1 Tax=Ferrovibrio sp. TaxID=1917215 RepID=UPI00391D67D2
MVEEANRDPQAFLRSFARGLAVIEALGRPPGRFTLAELATASDLNRAAARRVLLTLIELGYCKSDGKYYFLTPRTLGLGLSFLNGLPYWGYAQFVLEDLRAEVGESCAMAVLDGSDILYILRLPARRILTNNLGIGSRLPAHAVSLGRVLLAGLPEDELETYLAKTDRKAFTSRTLTDGKALKKELTKVRDQGYAWIESELDPAICGLSVPVRDAARNVMAAVSVNTIAGSLTEAQAKERLLLPLRKAAEEIRARSNF